MKSDNVSTTNNDERKDVSALDPKQFQPDDTGDKGATPEIRDSELEKLGEELKGLFSGLSDEDDSVHSRIRRSLLEDLEDNAYVVKHGKAINTVKSLLGSTVFTVKEEAESFEIHINSETILQVPSCNKGDEIYAIGRSVRGQFVAKIVSSESFFKMFDLVTNISDKLKMMKKYLQLSVGQQNNIKQQCLYRESPAPDQIPGEPSDQSHPEKPGRTAPVSCFGHPRSHHPAGDFQCRPCGDPAEKREVCPHQATATIPLHGAYHLRHMRQTLPPQNHRHGTGLDLLHLQFLR